MAMELWRTRPYSGTPWSEAVDRYFDGFFGPAFANGRSNSGGSTGFQSLPVNVWETADGYQAGLLAPGLDEKSINVMVHEDSLVIEGELSFETPEGAKPVWQEFGPAKFRRSLRLGASVDPAKVEAMYRNGLLMITMPKADAAKPRQIPVQVAKQ